MLGYGISGISPYTSPLGMFGLGGYNSYSSYYNPAMMGMGMGMLGGYYNPTFMANQMQQVEKSQLQHASAMHEMMLQKETSAFTANDRALFEKAMVDAAVNKGVQNLAAKIEEGDQDGICEEFDALKHTLYTKYSDYFKANSDKMDARDSVTNWIEILYSQIVSKQRGDVADLRTDIKKYGQTPFEHGFWKNFHGKDYHDKYTEETLSYLYDTRVDNKAGKDRMEGYGAVCSKVAEAGIAGVVGGGIGRILASGTKKPGKYAWAAAIGTAIADLMWQHSR